MKINLAGVCSTHDYFHFRKASCYSTVFFPFPSSLSCVSSCQLQGTSHWQSNCVPQDKASSSKRTIFSCLTSFSLHSTGASSSSSLSPFCKPHISAMTSSFFLSPFPSHIHSPIYPFHSFPLLFSYEFRICRMLSEQQK